ncbi:MAG: phage antirepressor KilAC domain-containing protein [Clostridium sp.]|nr:phage antirepressor KilAC domain-containing protein [Clostridium sp.]MCM1209098.1 phage antirepressor KilAC domain-containing protein [Ruminococcus sp.]
MSNSIVETTKIFKNKAFGMIRTVLIDDMPYFAGKDVATVLGYAKPLNAIATHIDEDDSLKRGLIDSMGRTQETILINESGLYSLILSSKLPSAKAFKHWVTSEVLPSIRKTGSYAVSREMERQEIMARALYVAQGIITELRPKAEYAELMLKNKMLIGDFGEFLKQSGFDTGSRKLYKWLRDNGYLINAGRQYNNPTEWAMDMGLFETEEMPVYTSGRMWEMKKVYITGKGQQFISEILKQQLVAP